MRRTFVDRPSAYLRGCMNVCVGAFIYVSKLMRKLLIKLEMCLNIDSRLIVYELDNML